MSALTSMLYWLLASVGLANHCPDLLPEDVCPVNTEVTAPLPPPPSTSGPNAKPDYKTKSTTPRIDVSI